MKTTLFLLLLSSGLAHAQWNVMQKYNEVGKGNYYLFARTEKDPSVLSWKLYNTTILKMNWFFKKGRIYFLIQSLTTYLPQYGIKKIRSSRLLTKME
jgi:hypothetical protein